jgi:hypothetical protein
MAPRSAAGKHLQVFPPIKPPFKLWGWGKWSLLPLSWIVTHDMLSGEVERPIEPDTARCTNCGHEMDFTQS